MSKFLGVFLGIVFSLSLGFQAWQFYKFVNAGARFTAKDGQVLCERLKELEVNSYEFREAHKTPKPCLYSK